MRKILIILGIWSLVLSNSIAFRNSFDIKDASVLKEIRLLGEEGFMRKMTPVLYVEAIEPCLRFWVDALGFIKAAEVTEGDRLGFVILTSGDAEVMLQSYASLDKDIPALGNMMRGATSALYIEVRDIDDIERRLRGHEAVVPKRETTYGATEIFYRSPGGHIIGFAERGRQGTKSAGQEDRLSEERERCHEKDSHFLDLFLDLVACRYRGRGDS